MSGKRVGMRALWLALGIAALLMTGASGKQVKLVATGNVFSDTWQLRDALNTHLPGDTILLRGHFRVGGTLWAQGFDGTIKGEGMNATFIEVTGYPPPPPPPFPTPDPWPTDPVYSGGTVFSFEQVPGADLTVMDLTVYYDGGVLGVDGNPLMLYAMVESYWGDGANVSYKNVRCATADSMVARGLVSWHSIEVAPGQYAPGNGKTEVKACELFGMNNGIVGGGLQTGSFSVTGCLFVGTGQGVRAQMVNDAAVDIMDNLIEWSDGGIHLSNSTSHANIKNNAIHGGFFPAINLLNCDGAEVKDNYSEWFITDNANRSVIRLKGSTNCLVANNTIANSMGSRRIVMEHWDSASNTYIENRFVNIHVGRAAFDIFGTGAILLNNDFTDSMIPGGFGMDPGLFNCISLMNNPFSTSNNVYVSQPLSLLPWINPDPAMQIYDYGIDNTIVITP